MRRSLALLSLIVVAGCSNDAQTGANGVLVGSWYRSGVAFTAATTGATFAQPCVNATFGAITLDSNRTFSVESTSLTESSNVMHQLGDVLHINGNFRGDSLTLTVYTVHLAGGGSDPINVVLPVGTGQPGVCTA